jgi:V-type H+-transporting ATPase subunit G
LVDGKQHSAGNKAAEDEANRDAEAKIRQIKEAGKKSQDKVVKDLIAAVTDVKPVPPSAA